MSQFLAPELGQFNEIDYYPMLRSWMLSLYEEMQKPSLIICSSLTSPIKIMDSSKMELACSFQHGYYVN